MKQSAHVAIPKIVIEECLLTFECELELCERHQRLKYYAYPNYGIILSISRIKHDLNVITWPILHILSKDQLFRPQITTRQSLPNL